MNKAITDGVDLMPPEFAAGLDVWSDLDGTPGSSTYDGTNNAALVLADSDFGSCLELFKTQSTQKLRFMGQTPLLAGCYLQIKVRVKAMSGNLPSVQIAGYAANGSGAHVGGLVEVAPPVALTTYGEVVELTAIVGVGNRTGVDMVWGLTPVYGHFGINLTGSNSGVVRIDDISIEDATLVFHRNLMDWVDVRDFGAIGNGVSDDSAAFEAADAAAMGRTVLVSKGIYKLDSHVTFESKVRFEGTVVMPASIRLSLTRNFDLPSYADAFGDEVTGLKKALQAMFNFSDHESLDMCGRRVSLTEPLDVHAAVDNIDVFSSRRVIRNGQLQADNSAGWEDEVRTSTATYSAAVKTRLSNVTNVAQIAVGSLVTGVGVGREVYVRSKNVAAGTIELNLPLWGAPTSQNYTFRRFKYLLDFSGFTNIKRFSIADVEFLCQGYCSGLMLPDDGLAFQVRDCFFTSPKDRAITSSGHACSGLQLDRNQFLSNEQAMDAQLRQSIAFNCNANDVKVRDNRAVRFRHFGVMAGSGHIIEGNHFFQGDTATNGLRTAGLVLSDTNCKVILNGNYIDNASIEWGNEHDEAPDGASSFSFGGLTVIGNIFTSSESAPWFRFIQIKPFGPNHFINGLSITGNIFKHTGGGTIERMDLVDESIGVLNPNKFQNITVTGNTYNNVDARTTNPVTVEMEEVTANALWSFDFAPYLPFGGKARRVVALLPQNEIKSSTNVGIYTMPYAVCSLGTNGTEINLHWSQAVKGKAHVTVRTDNQA